MNFKTIITLAVADYKKNAAWNQYDIPYDRLGDKEISYLQNILKVAPMMDDERENPMTWSYFMEINPYLEAIASERDMAQDRNMLHMSPWETYENEINILLGLKQLFDKQVQLKTEKGIRRAPAKPYLLKTKSGQLVEVRDGKRVQA